MSFVRHCLEYFQAVTGHWKAMLSGLVIVILLKVMPAFGAAPLPHGVIVWGLVITVFVGCFLAWRDKAKAIDALKERVQTKLNLSCGIGVPGSIVPTAFMDGRRVNYFRIVLQNYGASPIKNC